ncbi:hypothetical protein LJB88_02055, partial [Erysipelotrichaceae bacterium OttesenSCG-928-M19]|nr:hypothetical protein [Erysipelotrichaceae bacterium OttesenSCG-928-M19]
NKLRKVSNENLKPIEFTDEVNEKIKQWDYFSDATTQIINLISDQVDVLAARDIAIEWYKSCIKLGKLFYGVSETTDQIFNNLQMLIDDVDIANFIGIKRTFITTFTNVAKYQKEGDANVV